MHTPSSQRCKPPTADGRRKDSRQRHTDGRQTVEDSTRQAADSTRQTADSTRWTADEQTDTPEMAYLVVDTEVSIVKTWTHPAMEGLFRPKPTVQHTPDDTPPGKNCGLPDFFHNPVRHTRRENGGFGKISS